MTFQDGSLSREEAFTFTGSGSEYFRIWIVNLILSVVTLGIYSAWAKVRRLEYFYRNTRVAGASFDYHGRPLAILKAGSSPCCSSAATRWPVQSARWPDCSRSSCSPA